MNFPRDNLWALAGLPNSDRGDSETRTGETWTGETRTRALGRARAHAVVRARADLPAGADLERSWTMRMQTVVVIIIIK